MNMAYFPDHSVLSGLVAVLFLQLIMRISAHFTVVAHAEPPLTMIGEDATLRCHLFPKKSAEQMEVRWFRSQFSPAVYVYKDGKERDEEQMEEYRGRTTFVRDNIRDGNVALKIHNVTAFENGRYHCYFQEGRSYEEAFMDLKVTKTVWVSTSMPSESPSEFLDPTTPVPEKVSTWMIILTVALPALGLFIAFSIYFMWKQHKRKKTLFIEKEIECEEKEREFDKKGQEHTGKERECNLTGWRRTQLHAADVTLDRNTAHPELYLSSDLRSVMRGDTRQDLPDNPERFDCRPCVLGRESFTSGRHYWEVEVADVMVWALGVCSENSERKGEALLIPQNGFWVIELFGGRYQALTSPDILLPLPEHLDRVGIFLDYEAGDVSFYNMIDRSHIYTCPRTSFSGPIRPFFRLGSDDNPLVICPAFTGAEGVTVPKSGLILYRKLH
ncbi:butyrophilin subfamily 2 member A2-like isoform X7 [Phascolarctos cinereus]|uniref:Butyrophilin subfamily 2 member A2-like isoform X7 n=1 Tax=Phascolarctos cinereus TaxID=38626 RepID=A0A6P5IV44_PHACI|nr:butyrophilin subfamily 2 member A2-like isoform X7 [Phascolarctos cinereus]